MEIKYRLIFRGFKENISESEARKNLTEFFDLPTDAIDAMTSRPGDSVETGLTLADVVRLHGAVDAAGVLCVVEQDLVASPSTSASEPGAATPAQKTTMPPAAESGAQSNALTMAGSNGVGANTAAVHTRAETPTQPDHSPVRSSPKKTWSDPAMHLREALQQNKLRLYCQPILTLQNGLFEMAEVFVRLWDEEDALLPPGDFLPVFEHFRMLPDLDRWVVRRVIEQLRTNTRITRFSINVSGQTLADPAFSVFVADELKAAGTNAAALVFEIDESELLGQTYVVERFASAIKVVGCGVLIDSFSSSLASFKPLKNLNVDFVKLDGSIVRNILRNADALAKLNVVLRVSDVTDIGVIAECIEEPEIFARLKALGVGHGQGYGIVVPYPIEELKA